MSELVLTQVPVMRTGMLIRRPASEVFAAFTYPELTSKFWFTRGSSVLAPGAKVEWEWEMYRVSVPVTVIAVEAGKRIAIRWPGHNGPTDVEWQLADGGDGATFVEVTERGFTGTGDEVVRQLADSTEGFSLVLAGAKAWLEHGLRLELVRDRFPAERNPTDGAQ